MSLRVDWFHQISSFELAIVVVSVILVVSVSGLAVVAPRVRSSTLHQHFDNGTITGLFSALIGVYAVAARLTAVAAFPTMDDAASDVNREAAASARLHHDPGGSPQPLPNNTTRPMLASTLDWVNT